MGLKISRIFYGYWVLACCFLFTLVLESNIVVFSLFIKPLQTAFGWSQTKILAGSTVFIVANAITSPFAGRLVERYGARYMVSIGTLLIGAGFFLLGKTAALWQFYAGYVLSGLGVTAAGPITLTYVVSSWFERRRGIAVGAMSTGVGISSILFAPFVAVYLLPQFGWRTAYIILGAIHVVLIVPLSALVLRTRPSDLGLFPDGILPQSNDKADPVAKPGLSAFGSFTLRSAAMTSAFWFIGISLVFNHTHLGVLQTIFPHLSDIGFSPNAAASVVGLCGIVTTLGMFFFGWLCDRLGAPAASALGLGLMSLGITLLMFIGPQSPIEILWLSILVFGFGVGSWMPTMSMLTSVTFGMSSYATIFGTLTLFASAGAAAGPLLAGYVYDVKHSYLWAFGIIAALIILAIPAVLLVKRPKKISGVEHEVN